MKTLAIAFAGVVLAACSAEQAQTDQDSATATVEPEMSVATDPSTTRLEGSAFVELQQSGDGTLSYTLSGDVDADAIFQAGSVAKYVCTLAALDLQNSGELDLDATISSILPDYVGVGGDLITVRHLLQNRSGLEEQIVQAFADDSTLAQQPIASLDAANRFASSRPSFEPGTNFANVNANWILLQAILEAASGKPISDVLQERVFDPAGAENAFAFAGFPEDERALQVRTVRYAPSFTICVAGVALTAHDFLKLLQYPFTSDSFGGESLYQLTAVSTPLQAYTMGARMERVSVNDIQYRILNQSGSNGAFRLMGMYDPETGEALAFLTHEATVQTIVERRNLWLRAGNRTHLPRQ